LFQGLVYKSLKGSELVSLGKPITFVRQPWSLSLRRSVNIYWGLSSTRGHYGLVTLVLIQSIFWRSLDTQVHSSCCKKKKKLWVGVWLRVFFHILHCSLHYYIDDNLSCSVRLISEVLTWLKKNHNDTFAFHMAYEITGSQNKCSFLKHYYKGIIMLIEFQMTLHVCACMRSLFSSIQCNSYLGISALFIMFIAKYHVVGIFEYRFIEIPV